MYLFIFLLGTLSFFSACQEDDEDEMQGSVQFEMTDAPTDDASIEGVFVTVADIRVGNQSISGFNKTTFDIMAYQNGNTKQVANTNLDADSYNEVTLVLDYDEDADGNAPGCYVKEQGSNTKQALRSSSEEITLNKSFNVATNSSSTLIMDFNLRKCVKREQGTNDNYDFVSTAEMQNGVRLVKKSETGRIEGNCEDNVSNSDKIVVYAYRQGEYDRSTEVQGQGQSNVRFANAVASSETDANGDFQLYFLEGGEYELHYASYEENSNNGQMELQGTLNVSAVSAINLNAISVSSSTAITADVSVLGVLPL